MSSCSDTIPKGPIRANTAKATPMDTFTDGPELCRTYIHDRKEGDLGAA